MSSYELAKVLALLLFERGSYSYVDKISQTSSKDMALYYIREALRDYHSLASRGFSEEAAELSRGINFRKVEEEISKLKDLEGVARLREELSLIAAQALAEAGRLLLRQRRAEEQERAAPGAR